MPDDSANPELDAILLAGAEAQARFVAESKAMDEAWQSGTFGDWLKQKIEGEKHGDGGSGSGSHPE